MKIYIDGEYKCYVTDDGMMREVETNFFDGKSTRFIEGYRFVPSGESWTRSDGVVFAGEMVSPWKDYNLLAAYQEAYDKAREENAKEIAELEAKNADQAAALNAIYTGVIE